SRRDLGLHPPSAVGGTRLDLPAHQPHPLLDALQPVAAARAGQRRRAGARPARPARPPRRARPAPCARPATAAPRARPRPPAPPPRPPPPAPPAPTGPLMTDTLTPAAPKSRSTSVGAPGACLAALVSASWATRYSTSETSGASWRGSPNTRRVAWRSPASLAS